MGFFYGREAYHITHNQVVGYVLQAIREWRNCEENVIASEMRFSLDSYIKVEKGRKVITINEFLAWCESLEVNYGDVLIQIRRVETLLIAEGVMFGKKQKHLNSDPLPSHKVNNLINYSDIRIGCVFVRDPTKINVR